MRTALLVLVFTLAQPACLSGPVTKGALTVTCIDLNPFTYLAGLTGMGSDFA